MGLSLFSVDVESLRQAVRLHAVQQPEVDHLGLPPLVRGHRVEVDLVDPGRGGGVHIDIPVKGVNQTGVGGQMGQDSQLDLRVVGNQEQVALIGGEGAADRSALLGADRDVLKVWLFL